MSGRIQTGPIQRMTRGVTMADFNADIEGCPVSISIGNMVREKAGAYLVPHFDDNVVIGGVAGAGSGDREQRRAQGRTGIQRLHGKERAAGIRHGLANAIIWRQRRMADACRHGLLRQGNGI